MVNTRFIDTLPLPSPLSPLHLSTLYTLQHLLNFPTSPQLNISPHPSPPLALPALPYLRTLSHLTSSPSPSLSFSTSLQNHLPNILLLQSMSRSFPSSPNSPYFPQHKTSQALSLSSYDVNEIKHTQKNSQRNCLKKGSRWGQEFEQGSLKMF